MRHAATLSTVSKSLLVVLLWALGAVGARAAPAGWSWVKVPESKCASGTVTGFGVSPYPGSKRLLIYLEGGGSCADYDSCWGAHPTALHMAGYGKADFQAEPKLGNYVILSHDPNSGNPLYDANMVFVPYCTGDFHSGYNMSRLSGTGGGQDTYFWGGRDLDLFLAKVAAALPGVEQVWLVGTSAGGVGTTASYFKVRDTFQVRTDVINDSGTPLPIVNSRADQTLWGTPPQPGCESCTTAEQYVQGIRAAYPDARYALLSYAYDNVVAKSYGVTLNQFNADLNQTLTDFLPDPGFASFTVANPKSAPQHVVMSHFGKATLMSEMTAWLSAMVNDQPWSSQTVANP